MTDTSACVFDHVQISTTYPTTSILAEILQGKIPLFFFLWATRSPLSFLSVTVISE